MAKRALLCGCNYPGSQHALNGCVNDVRAMQKMLTQQLGFAESDITVLIDTDPSHEQPTGANIKRKLSELVAASQPGDTLFIHYSGHGTQVPASDAHETDAKDEALCPTDMNCITDDDLRTILINLPDGVKCTMVADCCHSGTLLDQPEVMISGPKSDDPDAPPQLIDTFTAAAGDPGSREVGCRSLPTNDYLAALGEKLGVTVEPTQVRAAMVAAFGSDATSKVGPLIAKFQEAVASAGGVEALANQAAAAASKLNDFIPGAGDKVGGLLGGLGGTLGGVLGQVTQPTAAGSGGSRGVGSMLFNLALSILNQTDVSSQLPPAGAKPSPEARLPAGKVVLVTGCQAHETSADACPSGNPAEAFGALTNALTTAVDQFKQAYPDKHVSARTLVHTVRESLNTARFAQNPCLECDAANADAGFVVV